MNMRDKYPLGTKMRIIKRLPSNNTGNVMYCEKPNGGVGIVGIVSNHNNSSEEVELSIDGNTRHTGTNYLGFFTEEEVELVDTTQSDTFKVGDVVIIQPGGYRPGGRALVTKWPRGWGVRLANRTAVEFLSGYAEPTNFPDDKLKLESSSKEVVLPQAVTSKYVGKTYWPRDNSRARCLTDPEFEYHLAGIGSGKAEQTTILLEPFQAKLLNVLGVETDYIMVIVQCLRGHYHQVLFDERGLTAPS